MNSMKGRIQKALSGFYYVDTGETVLQCRARGKFRKEGISPLVGDRVELRELGNNEGVVEKILLRRNAFSRPAVANIDQLVVIASASIPKTDPFLIDRVASIAALKDCAVAVVLNKCDLDPADALYHIYRASGFPTLRVSAETGEGMEALKALIAGKLSAFTGNSGVGKSSILNALDPDFHLQVGEVSTAFLEFAPYLDQCRFVGCSHTREKGCAVLEALEQGNIQKSRHASYLRLYEELKPLRDWQEKK